MSMQYIRDYYRVPVKRGIRVCVNGKPGRITSARGAHIMVRFDDKKYSIPCHPTWCVEYNPETKDKWEQLILFRNS